MSEENSQENASEQKAVLPETFKGVPALADFKDVESLGEAFVNLKKYQGSSIRIPGEDAGDDQLQEFRQKLTKVDGVMLKPNFEDSEQSTEFYRTLGRPEDADGYEFDPIEGYTPDETKFKAFKELALANNLTKAQANKMAKTMMEQDMQAGQARSQAMEDGAKELKQEWGQAYEENSKIAYRVAELTKAPEALTEAVKSGEAGPEVTKWLYAMSKKFGGEGQNLMEEMPIKRHDTPDEIRGKISDIMGNKAHPYFDATHPDHTRALEGMIELQRKLAG